MLPLSKSSSDPFFSHFSMASGGGNPRHGTQASTGSRSWAKVVGNFDHFSTLSLSTVNTKETMDYLKSSVKRVIAVDGDYQIQSMDHMKTALFGKFLGKSLPLYQVKLALSNFSSGYGSFSVANLPNGFLFINVVLLI